MHGKRKFDCRTPISVSHDNIEHCFISIKALEQRTNANITSQDAKVYPLKSQKWIVVTDWDHHLELFNFTDAFRSSTVEKFILPYLLVAQNSIVNIDNIYYLQTLENIPYAELSLWKCSSWQPQEREGEHRQALAE